MRDRAAAGHDGRHGQPARARDQPVPAAAQGQPGRLVAVVGGGLRRGAAPGRAGAAVGRVRGLPLVPRDGARVVRGRADRGADERRLRQRQGGPGGAAGRRRGLHGGDPGHDRRRRLADDLLPHPGRGAVLLRDLLPAAAVPPAAGGGRGGLAGPPGGGDRRRAADRRGAVPPARGHPGAAGLRGAGRRRRGAAGGLRRGARRLRRGAEIPALDGAGVPAPAARPHG